MNLIRVNTSDGVYFIGESWIIVCTAVLSSSNAKTCGSVFSASPFLENQSPWSPLSTTLKFLKTSHPLLGSQVWRFLDKDGWQIGAELWFPEFDTLILRIGWTTTATTIKVEIYSSPSSGSTVCQSDAVIFHVRFLCDCVMWGSDRWEISAWIAFTTFSMFNCSRP